MKSEIKISIRNLVEFVMRRGSIDNRYVSSIKALEGIRGHQKVQGSYGDNYMAEVSLSHIFSYEDVDIKVEGRADGILIEDEKVTIDEIKTTTRDLLIIDEDFNPLHWAQGKCYGYIYCIENKIDNIYVQITYYNVDTGYTRILKNQYSVDELERFFFSLLKEYKYWYDEKINWQDKRNKSISNLKFPFKKYRKGQRELAVRVYKSIVNSKKCFARAPTGIGKTISTLFPTIKAMGEGHTSKIFYLTAKTITREVAEDTINFMRKRGLIISSVTLTAKEKVCKMDEINCNPEYCSYANGYFDRLNGALKKIIKEYNNFDRKIIDEISEKYKLCPFELSLELTSIADIIVGDYNYVFDPRVYLKRFFEEKENDYTLLIDEGHNLVDRARSMYSSQLSEEQFIEVKKSLKKGTRLFNSIKDIIDYLKDKGSVLKVIDENYIIEKEELKEFYKLLEEFIVLCDYYLSKSSEVNKELLQLYFDIHNFIVISQYYDEHYVTLSKYDFKGMNIILYCVDPSKVIQDRMKKCKSSIIFSATLMPINYFKDIYGYKEGDCSINLQSPFNIDNRIIMIGDNVDTTYKRRRETSSQIVDYIINFTTSKEGNYIVFFPSYEYMKIIYEKIIGEYKDINILMQKSDMTEEEKEKFLDLFNEENEKTYIGFCVLGGHFSEGIDLVGDKLIGVIIVGVGMPQICIEREIIKNYFDKESKGFYYSYIYPGIIKVLQAAGRCIRTEEDRGAILLLDTRYSKNQYRSLLPEEWLSSIKVRSGKEVKKNCEEFWNKWC